MGSQPDVPWRRGPDYHPHERSKARSARAARGGRSAGKPLRQPAILASASHRGAEDFPGRRLTARGLGRTNPED